MTSGSMDARPARRFPMPLLLFGVVAVSAFYLGFLAFGVERARLLVKLYGYYTITGTFVWAVFALVAIGAVLVGRMRLVSRREWIQALALVAACTIVVLLTTPLNYKILYDEMVLQSTASVMHTYRQVATVVRGYLVDGAFAPLDTYVDKRPFFFPFLVSVLHDLTGYREGNAFVLNVALLPLVLIQLYLLVRQLAGHAGALAATIALGTLSTLSQSSTSAGMESLNLAMIVLTMHLAVLYLDAPDEPRLAALILSAVLLAQTRYESSLYVLPVALVVLEGWRRTGRVIMPLAAILAPALLIPYAVHNTYLSGTPSLWELHENAQTRFGTDNLVRNLTHASEYFFDRNTGLTNSLWLSMAGFVALGYALVQLFRHRREWRTIRSPIFVVLSFSLAILGNLGVLMFYYWGQLDDPTVSRLALPFSLLLAIAIGFAVQALSSVNLVGSPSGGGESRPGRQWIPWCAAGGAVLAYLWSGLVANEQHNRRNTLSDELAWETRYVEALPPGERIVISNKSALPWMLRRISAISIERARSRVGALTAQLRHETFRELLVTQGYRATSAEGEFRLDPADRLPDWFILEPIAEKRFGAHLDRISRLVEIKPHDSVAEPRK